MPKKIEAVAEYDRLYPQAHVVLPPWTPDDGDFPGHYARRPRGSRWLAAGKYQSAHGKILPSDIIPIDRMSKRQIRAELLDLVWRNEDPASDAGGQAARRLLELDEAPGDYVPPTLRRWLEAARESYPESIASWDPPANAWRPVYRRGWAPDTVRFPVDA